MELKEIKSIIDLMAKNDLTEFELEKDNMKIKLKRGVESLTHTYVPTAREIETPAMSALPSMPSSSPSKPALSNGSGALPDNIKEIKAPMVGTLYRSPSPESPPYIEIGQAVTEDTVVCIIEAMKVMNEIKAEVRGVITEILVENAKPVEFGKPLFRVRVN